MPSDDALQILPGVEIPPGDLSFVTSRSSGPGGQNVNKVETRVTAQLDLSSTEALTGEQKEKVRERLRNRINQEGLLQVSCQEHRTQGANREAAVARLASLLAGALEEEPERIATRVPRKARRRRLKEKRKRGQLKENRRPPERWEG